MSVAVHSFPKPDEIGVGPLLKQVSETYRTTRANYHDFSKLHEAVMQLERVLVSIHQDGLDAGTVLNGVSPEVLASVNEAYCFWQSRTEEQFAQQFVLGGSSLHEYCLYYRFATLVRREQGLLSGARIQKILFIGDGALPVSALLLHAATGAPVDCVVRDSRVID